MTDIFSRISDDIDEYLDLCKEFHEQPKYRPTAQGTQLPDCYGEHADQLKSRRDKLFHPELYK